MKFTPDQQPDSQQPQTAEQFAAFLGKRAQEAIAASVHHASLSQQYMSLSQRFAALAEQAISGNSRQAFQSLLQLEREATTGAPAAPIHAPLATAVPVAQHAVGTPGSPETPAADPSSPPAEVPFYSPPARFATTDMTSSSINSHEPRDSAPGCAETEPSTTRPATDESSPVAAPAVQRRKKRRRLSVRSVVERTQRVALEAADRVRVKAKKSDLKPQLRSTSEELTQELKRGSKPAVISFIVTGLILLLMTLRHLTYPVQAEVPPIIASISDSIAPVEETIPIEPPAEETGEQMEQMVEEPEPEPVPEPMPEPEPSPPVEPAIEPLPETPDGTESSAPETTTSAKDGDIDNRSEAGRKVLLGKYGGSAASESAVGSALEWIASQQRINGTWDFIDIGPCSNPGSVNNPIGGTAYALLPFLAAGHTHKDGPYKKQIQAGLSFLTSIGIAAPAGYDLRGYLNKNDDDAEPNYAYYVHGAATLALCDAYGMTGDRKLKQAAEGAVLFLINSQDPNGGGWRYNPRQPGSTSATAIQLMALKAAEKAGIRIPDNTWKGISHYMDSVSVDRHGRYGYEIEKKTYAMSVTAMALLSRMYLGWGRDDGDMRAGIALIDKSTSTENYYTNYFATQVMKNWGGREWDRWNGRIRDQLIARQEKAEGPEKGSWAPVDRADYSKSGGRLLTTCLATLTLEVYYRNKPLLPDAVEPGESAVERDSATPGD